MTQKEQHAHVLEELIADPSLIDDKAWRMNNLYWINTKNRGKVLFKMNRAQDHFFKNFINIKSPYYRHIILKSRQLGFTTFIALFILDEVLFGKNREAMFIAHKLKNAQETFDGKVYFAIRNMCPEIKDAFFKVNRNSVRKIQVIGVDPETSEENGSTSNIQVDVSGRGNMLHLLHVSEFAKLCVLSPRDAAEVITGTFSAVPFNGSIFIESTAEGMSGAFYDTFNAGWGRRDEITPMVSRVEFYPHFYNWQWDDEELDTITETIPVAKMDECEIPWGEYQLEHGLTDKEITYYYMKYLQQGRDIHKLRQEFPTTAEEAFVNSGQMYFPTTRTHALLQAATDGTRGAVIVNDKGKQEFQAISNGDLYVLRHPEPGTNYVIGGDTAEGLAHGDSQVLSIINAKTELIDAVYHSKIAPDEFADIAYDVGKYYNYALMAIESNKDGLWVNSHLEKKGYHNLYYRQVLDDITKQWTKYYGWKTTSTTRPFMLVALKTKFTQLGSFPKMLLEEMLKFVRNVKGRPEAMSGEHDDIIMASAVGYSVLQERGKQSSEEAQKDTKVMMDLIFGDDELGDF